MNFYNYILKQIHQRDSERILYIVRRHWTAHGAHIIVSLVLLSIPFMFLVPLYQRTPYGIAVFFGLLAIGILYTLRSLMLWYTHVFVFTNRRVVHVHQQGIFSKRVTTIWLPKIRTVSASKKGIVQTMLNVGDVYLHIAGKTQSYGIMSVARPHDVLECIESLQEAHRQGGDGENQYLSEDAARNLMDWEVEDMLRIIKNAIGDNRFELLLNRVMVHDDQESERVGEMKRESITDEGDIE